MSDDLDYSPLALFALPLAGEGQSMPRVFGAPSRYVQGAGVIRQAGHYLSRLGFRHCAILASTRCMQAEGGELLSSMQSAGLTTEVLAFGGECSLDEINVHRDALARQPQTVDSLVAVGGGKAVDAGRAIAHRLGIPVAVVPSLASNDAPCAAVSVIYTPAGETADAEVYDSNPELVLVDTAVIAGGGERYLVAGMGDAMATWYEARATARSSAGINVFGSRPTLAATALAQLCADTLYAQGVNALRALREQRMDESLEQIVEANVLLSGLGYESGGIAASHAVAQGYTMIARVHEQHLHGEMVAMGVLAQLCLEADVAEARRAAAFFAEVGLPVCLSQLGLDADNTTELALVTGAAMAFPFLANMPDEVTQESLLDAIVAADRLGREFIGASKA